MIEFPCIGTTGGGLYPDRSLPAVSELVLRMYPLASLQKNDQAHVEHIEGDRPNEIAQTGEPTPRSG